MQVCTVKGPNRHMLCLGRNAEEIITHFGSSWISQNITLITASDLPRKRAQPAKYTKKPNDVVLGGRSAMYLPHFFPWSSCGDISTKGAFKKLDVTYYGRSAMDVFVDCNFYQTLWSLPDPLEVYHPPQVFEENGQESASWIMVWSKEDGCLALENKPFEKKPGQPGDRRRPCLKLRSKELRQLLKLAEHSPAKKGSPGVYSAMSTGHSTTPSSPGLVPPENGTATGNGSSISMKSSKRVVNTLGSGDDDPNDEQGQKCLEASDSRPLVQRVRIARREQLDNLNPMDVILILDTSTPIEERSQILREGQARNFQFDKNRSYYEAVYNCIIRNTEAEDQEAAPAVLELGQEVPAVEPVDDDSEALDNEQDAEAEEVLEHGQPLPAAEAQLADLLPEGVMEGVDDDAEAMEKVQDADYSPSDSDGPEEENDAWLQFPYFFEENIVENLDLPAIDAAEEQEVPEENEEDAEQVPEENEEDAAEAEHQEAVEHGQPLLLAAEAQLADLLPEGVMEGVDDDAEAMEKVQDADYSPSDSDGLEEENDAWLQFPYFFEENIVENLDWPAIDAAEEQGVPQENEEDSDDDDDDDDDFFSNEAGSNTDSAPSDDEDDGDDWLQFPFIFEEEDMEQDQDHDTDYFAPSDDEAEGDDWIQFPFFFEEEDMEQGHDADYFPSDSDGADETEDSWLQFPYFFEENVAQNLDLPAIDSGVVELSGSQNDVDGNALIFPLYFYEEEEHSSDSDYAPTEEEDPNADEAELWSNADFMDDLYTESESDSDDMGKDPDYYPSSGSDDTE